MSPRSHRQQRVYIKKRNQSWKRLGVLFLVAIVFVIGWWAYRLVTGFTSNYYDWESPGGTVIHFKTENFPGRFNTRNIEEVFGPYCSKKLVVNEVNVVINDGKDGIVIPGIIDPKGGSANTTNYRNKQTSQIYEIRVEVHGGAFADLKAQTKEETYFYQSIYDDPMQVTALEDLQGAIFEEVAVHVCRRTTHAPQSDSEEFESEQEHIKFLLGPRKVLFRPDGW
ncbi:hypothetical protein GW793_03055 [bacterium]|nr:hypothetical protein [bacterium]